MSDALTKLQERKDRASKLLFKAERYITTWGVPATALSSRAGLSNNYIADIRSGSIPRHESMDALDRFMDENPEGFPYRPPSDREDDKIGFDAAMDIRRQKISGAAMVVSRDPCWKCGTRGDLGCEHRPAVEAVPLREAIG